MPDIDSLLNKAYYKDDKGIFDEKAFQLLLLEMLGALVTSIDNLEDTIRNKNMYSGV